MKALLSTVIIFCFEISYGQNKVGVFEHHADVGNPKLAGSAVFKPIDQSYSLMGSGYNIWFERDEFHFVYNPIKGDFTLTAKFEFLGNAANPHRKIGWMVRESLDKGAAHISAVAHYDGLTVMQWRVAKDASMRDPEDEIFSPKKNTQVIQLQRSGKKFTMRVGSAGEPLEVVGAHEMEVMQEEVLAGLFICSHDPDAVAEARIWDVKITRP